MYAKSKVTSKFQITLPKKIRENLGIREGDEVVFEGKGDDVSVKVEKRIDPVETLVGMLDGLPEGEGLEELKAKAASSMLKRKLGL